VTGIETKGLVPLATARGSISKAFKSLATSDSFVRPVRPLRNHFRRGPSRWGETANRFRHGLINCDFKVFSSGL
jgi:hypothetical protein